MTLKLGSLYCALCAYALPLQKIQHHPVKRHRFFHVEHMRCTGYNDLFRAADTRSQQLADLSNAGVVQIAEDDECRGNNLAEPA